MRPGTVQLRNACMGDITFIRAIEANPEYAECIGRWSEAEYREAISSTSACVVVAEDSEGIAGFYVLRGIKGKDRSLELMRIAVCKPGAGVGSLLLQHVIHEAFETYGAHRLWLDVFTTNLRAQRLYASLGFVLEGTLRESKFRHGKFQSQHLMSMLEDEYRVRYVDTAGASAGSLSETGEQQ